MTPQTQKRLIRFGGYPAFFGFSLLLCLYLTFPYEALGKQVMEQARDGGIALSYTSLGLGGFFGFRAKNLSIGTVKSPTETQELVVLDAVTVRPGLFPLGIAYSVDFAGGTISGNVGLVGSRSKISSKLRNLSLEKSALKETLGADAGGTLEGDISLELDGHDLTKSSGTIELKGDKLVINGGTVANYDLPRVDMGKLQLKIEVKGGSASLDALSLKGEDIEADGSGSITLASRLLYSTPRVDLHFKPSDGLFQRIPYIKPGLSFAGFMPDSRGFFSATVEGLLGKPNAHPKR